MKQNSRIDSIHLRGLRLKCHIGVTTQERRKEQVVTADLALKCDLRKAGLSDRLEDTLDYSSAVKKLAELAGNEKFSLLEALAERLAQACLDYPGIGAVTVKVAKKGVLPDVRSVEIEIMRQRG